MYVDYVRMPTFDMTNMSSSWIIELLYASIAGSAKMTALSYLYVFNFIWNVMIVIFEHENTSM